MRIPIETLTLDNGLTVVLSQDQTAPIVAVNLWYHVGSGNERAGRTGFAHLFEHMLFQGSEHVAANEHFELIARAGGTLNGSTWLDRTNYYETVPSNQLALALWLEADRMGALLPGMTQEKLDTQRDVVKNERRWSVDNQPYGTWWEKLPALAYPPEHPFHHSLIGSFEDLDAASLPDVSEFFATYYTPGNAVLSLAGDFDREDALDLIHRFFGAISKGAAKPPLADTSLPPVFGAPLREVVQDNVTLPRLYLAFRAPEFGTPRHYDASVCATILGTRKTSRLQRSLIREKRLAAEVSAFTFDLAKGADLLVIDVLALPGVTAEALEAAVLEEVDRIHREGVTEEEVARAIAMIETGWTLSMESATDRADKLSMFATYFGDAQLVNEQPERFREVTAERVSRFARERLGANNRATLLFVPADTSTQVAA